MREGKWQIGVEFDIDKLELIESEAKKRGMKVSTFVRYLVLKYFEKEME